MADNILAMPGTEPTIGDIANGRRFVQMHGENVRYVPPWKRWLTWDGVRWSKDVDVAVERMAKETSDTIWDVAKSGNSTALAAEAKRIQGVSGLRAMLETARSEVEVVVQPHMLDADPWLLNTPSGTIDLRTGDLAKARREDLITKVTAACFDPGASCQRWEQFLGEVFVKPDLSTDRELIDYIQRLAGYSLTGSTKEQMFAILHGTGANGKGVFTNTLYYALGDYSRVIDANTLLSKKSEDHPTGMANLFGRRLVVSAETDAGRRLNEALVKNVTGSDPISARRMHEDFWEFTPTHTLMLATNHKPEIRGTDEGIWRRIHLIPFNRAFPANQQDPDLENALQTEAPGILAWMVRGCLEWQRVGLRPPPAVVEATKEYRQESDQVARFLGDCCVTDNRSAFIPVGALFEAYTGWCAREGEEPLSGTAFGRELTTRGFPSESVYVTGGMHRIRKHIGLREAQ
jgi:putative DNA primase/helicase